MPFRFNRSFFGTVGFRLTSWYSGIFIVSSLVLLSVSYFFVFSHMGDQRSAIQSQLRAYAALVETGGVAALDRKLGEQRDPSRRNSFFARIADNAIKYTPAGGHAWIEGAAGAGQVPLLDRDTGVGITVEDLPRIWDRLYRGDKRRSQRGLGLGLSLVKAVVQAHQGRVEVALIRTADRPLRYPCLSPRLSRIQQSLKNVILAKAASNGCARLNLPPWYYVPLHPEAKLSAEEREMFVKWAE